MKIGDFEGTSQEFKDVCQNHGFDPSNFLNTPPKFKPHMWIMIILICICIIISICIWTLNMEAIWLKLFIVLNLAAILILTGTVHLRFEKWVLTMLTFIGGLIVLSVCLGYITPKEAIDDLKNKVMPLENKAS